MRKRFLLLTALVLVVTLATEGLANVASSRNSRAVDQGFVAPQICPQPSGPSQLTLVGTDGLAVTAGRKLRTITKTAGKERFAKTTAAAYVTGDDHAAALSTLTPKVAVTDCRAATIDSWFVGGSGVLESQSAITLVNQAAGPATAEVTAWTPTGVAAPTTLTIAPMSTVKVSLDRYSAASVVTRVRALSGRLGTSLLDVRSKGLTKYGADYVPAQAQPQKKLVILGVIGNSASRLRLLVPGTQDAVVRADISYGTFRYTPAGLDDLRVKAGTVVEVPITTKDSKGFGALTINSDVPIVAGVYTPLTEKKKQIDFLWLAPSQPLVASAIAPITQEANNSILLFTEGATVSLQVSDISGKAKSSLAAAPISITAVKRSWRLDSNSGAYLARVIKTKAGMSILPINPVERTQKRLEPVVDLGVLSPR